MGFEKVSQIFGHISENLRIFFYDREKNNFFSELEFFLDMYSDSEFHDLSNGAIFRAIPTLLHGVWSSRKKYSFFSTHET